MEHLLFIVITVKTCFFIYLNEFTYLKCVYFITLFILPSEAQNSVLTLIKIYTFCVMFNKRSADFQFSLLQTESQEDSFPSKGPCVEVIIVGRCLETDFLFCIPCSIRQQQLAHEAGCSNLSIRAKQAGELRSQLQLACASARVRSLHFSEVRMLIFHFRKENSL